MVGRPSLRTTVKSFSGPVEPADPDGPELAGGAAVARSNALVHGHQPRPAFADLCSPAMLDRRPPGHASKPCRIGRALGMPSDNRLPIRDLARTIK